MSYKRENTDEITCPYCDHEYSDSWEYIPQGENDWTMECVECEKEFKVSFDPQNVNDGYSNYRMNCEDGNHTWIVIDGCYKRKYKNKHTLSDFARLERCEECGESRTTDVHPDGRDFTKEEILAIKSEIRGKNKPKIYHKKENKTAMFEVSGDYSELKLKTKEPEGNIHVWVALSRFLLSKGFTPQPLPDYLRNKNIHLKRGWLECEVSVMNHAVNVKFYQNEVFYNRKEGDGRYEHYTYEKLLSPQKRLELRAVFNMICKYYRNLGFTQIFEKTDLQRLKDRLKVEDLKDWVDPENHYKRDYEDRDRKIMKSGQEKYFYDRKVLKKGIIYWNNGNQWYVMTSEGLRQQSHWELFDYQGEPKRKPLCKDSQIQRLYSELTKNEKLHNYDRCKAIWALIEEYKLYNVWSIKHNAWWGANNAGYTDNKQYAGVYTHENITKRKSYYDNDVDSKAVLIS